MKAMISIKDGTAISETVILPSRESMSGKPQAGMPMVLTSIRSVMLLFFIEKRDLIGDLASQIFAKACVREFVQFVGKTKTMNLMDAASQNKRLHE